MTPCAVPTCLGTLQLVNVDAERGAATATWCCRTCSTTHVQPVIVCASTTSGHGQAGARKFVHA